MKRRLVALTMCLMLVVPGTYGNNTFTVRAAEDVSDVATTEISTLSVESEEVVEDAANEGSDTDESSDDADTEISSSTSEETVTEETDSAETEEASDETEAVTDADASTASDSTESSTDSSSDDASAESSVEAGSDASTEASSDSSSEASSDASTEASSDASTEASTEITYPEYSYSDVVDGYSISLYAPENVFPEDTTVTIERVEDVDNTNIADILAEELEDGEVVNIISFDITFYNGEEEIEPKDGSVTVEIGIAKELDETENVDGEESTEGDIIEIDPLNAISDDAAESAEKVVRVFHISDDKTVDKIDSTVNDGNVTYDAEEFSVYSIAVITLNADSTLTAAVHAAFDNGYIDISTVSGYDCVEYFDDIVEAALDYISGISSSSLQCEIYIPSGTYSQGTTFYIPSYTTIHLADDAVINLNVDSNMFVGANVNDTDSGWGTYNNIVIEGGTYNCGSYNHTAIRFGHMQNVTIKNATFTNSVKNHIMEFGAVKGITITNSNFSGLSSYDGELIELDCMTDSEAFPQFKPYDYYCCEDVTISDCSFKNCGRGLGSHRNAVGYYFNNIKVTGCTFENHRGNAIEARQWTNSSITGNTFTNVGSGINTQVQQDTLYKGNSYSKSKLTYTANVTISDNTINLTSNSKQTGILLAGYTISSSSQGVADGTYNVNGFTASNNTINIGSNKAVAIKLFNSDSNTVTNNTCVGNSTAAAGIHLSVADSNNVSGNTLKNYTSTKAKVIYSESGNTSNTIDYNNIYNSGAYAIYLDGCTDKSVSHNTIYGVAKKGGIGIFNKAKVKAVNYNIIAGSKKDGIVVYNKAVVTTMKYNNISDIKRYGVNIAKKATVKKIINNVIDSKKNNIFVASDSKGAGFSFTTTSLGVGEKVKLKKFYANGKSTTFSNTKSSVASVSNGKIKGVKKGKTKVILKMSGAKGYTVVKVGSKPESVSVTNNNVTLGVNEASAITPTVNSGAGCAVYKYSSSNKGVAKVTKTGVIEAVGAGTATITVKTYNGKETTVNVTVQ